MNDNESNDGLGFLSVWALTTGGMVGGGIYTALGVVVAIAMQWSWLAFVIAGLVVVGSAWSYTQLSLRYDTSGGAFEFLRDIDREGLAGTLSWVLIVGYLLTIALYAYAFGHYLSFAFSGGPMLTRGLALGAALVLTALNLAGVGKLAVVEIAIVTSNLLFLVFLGVYGVAHWDWLQLMAGAEPRPWWSAFIGAAAIFVAYEGFQLLSYDYDEIKDPQRHFTPAVMSGVVFVVAVYVLVAIGATMLAGALAVIDQKQVALAEAADLGMGTAGFICITVAAVMATSAAINSTLFSTAKLAQRVAEEGELPAFLAHRNRRGIPDRAVVLFGSIAGLLSISGSLSTLVETASLVFLLTFGLVNLIAAREVRRQRWLPIMSMVVGGIVLVLLLGRLMVTAPVALAVLVAFLVLIFTLRPAILNHVRTYHEDQSRGEREE